MTELLTRETLLVLTPSNGDVCVASIIRRPDLLLLSVCQKVNVQTSVVAHVCFCLQSDIMDVNQIFKDLAVMIHDQGEMIGR